MQIPSRFSSGRPVETKGGVAVGAVPLALPHPATKRRDELSTETCECLIDIVAALFSLPSKDLRKPGRAPLPVARVRQLAMYVAHVVLRLSMGEVGNGFGMDRTTVLHACKVIEDMRDDADFERIVSVTEQVAFAAFRNRLGL